MNIYIKKENKELEKITKKDLKSDLSLHMDLQEKYTGEVSISLYRINKEEDSTENYLLYKINKVMDGKNLIHHIPEKILDAITEKEEYLYILKTADEVGEYRFKIQKNYKGLLILIPIVLLAGLCVFFTSNPDIKVSNPIETIRDVEGEVEQGVPKVSEMSEKDALLHNIQSYSRFVVSSAIKVNSNLECAFEISNPDRTTFQSEYSLDEINKILEGELKVYPTQKEDVYEYDSINTIQVSLQNEAGEEYYCSPALEPDTYIDTVKLSKDIKEDTVLAIVKTFNDKGEYQNSFQFTIQVNR